MKKIIYRLFQLLGFVLIGYVIKSAYSGSIIKLEKNGYEEIILSDSPERFYLNVIFWIIGALLLIIGPQIKIRTNH